MTIVWAIAKSGITATCAEARRLICCGIVEVDGRRVEDIDQIVDGQFVLSIGRHKHYQVNTRDLRVKNAKP